MGCTTPPSCSEGSLVQCAIIVEECSLGCIDEATGSRCRSFDPTGTPKSTELRLTDLDDFILNDDYVFDTDTGVVQRIGADGALSPLREANASEVPEVSAGIGYRRYGDRAAFYFKSLQVDAGVPRNFIGRLPLTIIANTVNVRGRWFLPCGALGGGTLLAPGLGAGAPGQQGTISLDRVGGGGGAGHAIAGGNGLYTTVMNTQGPPGAPGVAYGGLPFEPLYGGSMGGPVTASATEAGRGGAALQLIALSEVIVGGGATTTSGISVGGCGGKTPVSRSGGAGGGSGGTLLIESPSIRLERGAILAANGGGGGASVVPEALETLAANEPAGTANPHLSANDGTLGSDGAGSDPGNTLDYVQGGRGGSANTADTASISAKETSYWRVGSNRPNAQVSGPGGGGSHGYIQLRTKDGTLTFREPSVQTSPQVAPYFDLQPLVLQ